MSTLQRRIQMVAVAGCLLAGMSAVAGMDDGLVAWYRASADAQDSTTNGHNGSFLGTGVSYTGDRNGVVSNSFHFDGLSGSIFVPDTEDLDTPYAFTLSAWINPSSYNADPDSALIIAKWFSWGWGGEYFVNLGPTGELELQ